MAQWSDHYSYLTEDTVHTLRSHPIIFALGIAALAMLSLFLGSKIAGDPAENTPQMLLIYAVPMLLAAGLIWLLRKGDILRWPAASGTHVWAGWPILLSAMIFFIAGWLILPADFAATPGVAGRLGWMIAAVAATALFEELIYRGIILDELTRALPVQRAVLISSAIFALSHAANLIAVPSFILGTLVQVVYTFFMALVLSAVYLRSRNIWLVVLLHAAFNLLASFTSVLQTGTAPAGDIPVFAAALQLLMSLPMAIGGWRLYRSLGTVEYARVNPS